jgi:hypothetical protein
VPKVVKP